MLVSLVQPVIMRSAEFCTVCSFCLFVVDMIGDQIELPYSRIGRVMALYVELSVSLFFPQWREEMALSMLSVFFALSD